MKTVIPQKTLVKCDVCEKECDGYNRKQSGELIVNQDALDFQGMPVANGNISFDLCDCCLNHLIKTINEEIDDIRTKANEARTI